MQKVVLHSVLVENPDIEKALLEKTGMNLVFVPNSDVERFYEEIKDADGVIVADRLVPAERTATMKNCKIIARQGIGYDSIDLVLTKERNIAVTNVPDYCVEEVSDFTVTMMLNLLRHIDTYNRHTREGIWDIQSVHTVSGFPPMRRFSTQTVGIFGFGRIARLIAKKLKPFGFKILATDPYVDTAVGKQYDVTLTDFDTVVRQADIVTINTPLTPETRHCFNLDVFKKMKPTSYLVNTGRGPLVKEQDLYTALKDRIIAGAAIDVTETEPLPKDNPLFTLDNLLITPHAAFFTKDSYEELRRRACEEVIRVLQGKEPENRVNK